MEREWSVVRPAIHSRLTLLLAVPGRAGDRRREQQRTPPAAAAAAARVHNTMEEKKWAIS
jgi:hypothetical protein